MEIRIKGEGEIIVRFVDRVGTTLIERKYATSGSETIQARATIPLTVETANGPTPVVPVLSYQSSPGQQVTFDGQEPASFSRKRSHDIGCTPSVAADIERGCAQGLGLSQSVVPPPVI